MAPKIEETGTYFTQAEAAKRLGITQQAVSKAINQGRLKSGDRGIEAGELMKYAWARGLAINNPVLDPGAKALLSWLLDSGKLDMMHPRIVRKDPVASVFSGYLTETLGLIVDYDPGAGGLFHPMEFGVGTYRMAPWLERARRTAIGWTGNVTTERIAQLLLLFSQVFGDEEWKGSSWTTSSGRELPRDKKFETNGGKDRKTQQTAKRV